MDNYRKINSCSALEELKSLELSNNFIMPEELDRLKKALNIKKKLTNLGYFIEHYQKKNEVNEQQANHNYVFIAKKDSYSYGEVGDSFYMPVFKIWSWLQKNGEV